MYKLILCPECNREFYSTPQRLKPLGETLICPFCGNTEVEEKDEDERSNQS